MVKKKDKTSPYARNPYSIEDGIKYIIDKIGDEGLREATGKGYESYKKMSNPTHPGRNITVKDAVDLDTYCKQKGLGNPILDCYKTIIKKVETGKTVKTKEEIQKSLLQIIEEMGDVSSKTRDALQDGEIQDHEREPIAKEIKEVELLISDLKQKLDLGKKHDYKHRTGEKMSNRDEDGLKSE